MFIRLFWSWGDYVINRLRFNYTKFAITLLKCFETQYLCNTIKHFTDTQISQQHAKQIPRLRAVIIAYVTYNIHVVLYLKEIYLEVYIELLTNKQTI